MGGGQEKEEVDPAEVALEYLLHDADLRTVDTAKVLI